MLSNIVDRTSDYELKKGILKYSISFHMAQNDHVHALREAKSLYVYSRDNYDIEESVVALDIIIYNLARLKQIDKINDLMNDKIVKKTMASGKILTYRIYALLGLGRTSELIKIYKKNRASIKGEIAPSLVYNVAEAYFRLGDYASAVKY
jgi:hypothetical protein